jgi:hypothetical protein
MLRAPSGPDTATGGLAIQKRADNRHRRNRGLTAGVAALSLAVTGLGIGAYIGRDQPTTVVSENTDDSLRLLPSWTPDGTKMSIFEGPYRDSLPNSVTVWGTKPEQIVRVSVYLVAGVEGGITLEEALSKGYSNSYPDGGVGLDWSDAGLMVSLWMPNGSKSKLREVATSLSVNRASLKVKASSPPLGLPLRWEGTQNELYPAQGWSIRLGRSDLSVAALIPNELGRDLFGDPYPVPAQSQTVQVRGRQASTFANKFKGQRVQHVVQWSEGEWTVRGTGEKADDVLRLAQSLDPASKAEWASFVERPSEAKGKEPDPVLQTVSAAGVEVDVTLVSKDASCIEAVLKVPGIPAETVCVPSTSSTSKVAWSGLRSGNGKRYAVAFVSDGVDAVTAGKSDRAASNATVSSAGAMATWAEGVVVKTAASTYTWVGVVIAEVPDDGSPVALDVFEKELPVDAGSAGEPEPISDADPTAEIAEDDTPPSTDYPIRFLERIVVK